MSTTTTMMIARDEPPFLAGGLAAAFSGPAGTLPANEEGGVAGLDWEAPGGGGTTAGLGWEAAGTAAGLG